MKDHSEDYGTVLKQSFCRGEEQALKDLLEMYFGEIWANINMYQLDIQTDALFNLEIELMRDAHEFCESSESVALWLRKKFRERLRALGGKTTAFDETYMTPKEEQHQDIHNVKPTAVGKSAEEKTNSLYILNLLHRFFLPSLSPIEQVLFEVKKIHGLKGKNGIFQVAHFFANTVTMGHPQLKSVLKKEKTLYEPLISEFFTNHAKAAFTKYGDSNAQSLQSFLENLPIDRSTLKKGFHRFDMHLFRQYAHFEKKLKETKNLSLLERAIFFINEYSKLENNTEIWVQVNLIAGQSEPLKKIITALGIWEEKISEADSSLRNKNIQLRFKMNKKFVEKIDHLFQKIQDQIETNLNREVKWKTK